MDVTNVTNAQNYYNDLVKRGILLPGQSVPGYNPSQLPKMKTPSTQYWQRMGPQAQQQYYGYQTAQSGFTPEESQYRVWKYAPPSGQNQGLRYRFQ